MTLPAISTTFRTEDLVLKVRPDYDPKILRLDKYEAFLDALCGSREYQKDAIRDACRFVAGGMYENARELALENFDRNPLLRQRYLGRNSIVDALPFPDRLAASIDLATGTGKSWVIYGIARILMAENVVDRVLVLCPSLTIEAALTRKFLDLSSALVLTELLPATAVFKNPSIRDANTTTGPGDICVENIDATYAHVRSSVADSFKDRGATTLVLNDECHHVYSPPTGRGNIKKWRQFLESPDFSFRRILGFSGTCYTGDEYFPDVIYRYSLRQAMDDGRVKEVRYDVRDESSNQTERFQKYIRLHELNRSANAPLKPLSIVVTSRVNTANELAREFIPVLAEKAGINTDDASARVMVVTSSEEHRSNVARLPDVDRDTDPIEWIFSVSMLTEGWDVQNVFQVVPHEKRAFSSKLLIAQVLGRGLRVPPGTSQPVVWVFNHAKWSGEIARLVQEVLEEDRRLRSYPVGEELRASHHFELHDLSYRTRTTVQELTTGEQAEVALFKRGYLNFETQPGEVERDTVFVSARTANDYRVTTSVGYQTYTVAEVVQRLQARLKSIDLEQGTKYRLFYPRPVLRKVIEASLDRIGETRGLVTEQNLQHAYRAMGNTQRSIARTVRIEREPDQLLTISTRDMRMRSVTAGSFLREATVFYDSESESASQPEDAPLLGELASDDSPYPRRSSRFIANLHWFKSPVNVVLTSHEPERRFVQRLFDPEVADRLEAWVKSPDTGFYGVSYSWRRGDHTKLGVFNPDLFIKLANTEDVLVVELKDDDDTSDENRAKLAAASEHFRIINATQSEVRYHVMFLSPGSYDPFFQQVKAGAATSFVSALQAALLE